MHPWQRQPDEAPADFSAFVTYLRLKGRRSHRAVAAQTGRSLGAIRRLSAQFNWLARVAAFETRLADASQGALDLLVRSTATRTTADSEQLREAEFQPAQRVLHESRRWLELASDPRRRNVALGQICRIMDLATKLGRLAAGMPTGDEPRRRPSKEGAPGYWTGPSVEEALQKIYGSPSSADSLPPKTGAPGSRPASADESGRAGSPLPASTIDLNPTRTSIADPQAVVSNLNPEPANLIPATCHLPLATTTETPVVAPDHRRRDAWAAWTRIQSQRTTATQR